MNNTQCFFEGSDIYKAKGSVNTFFEEDEGILQIKPFEISTGRDPELYLTTDGNVRKSLGYLVLMATSMLQVVTPMKFLDILQRIMLFLISLLTKAVMDWMVRMTWCLARVVNIYL